MPSVNTKCWVTSAALLWVVCAVCCQATPPGWIDGVTLQKIIEDLVERSMGKSQFQDHVDKFAFTETKLNGQDLLDQYVSDIGSHINNTFEAVWRTKHAIEEGYNEGLFSRGVSTDNRKQCCKSPDNEMLYSGDFITKVDTSSTCFRFSADANVTALIPYSTNLRDVMKENKNKEPALKWQYYGTEEGTFVKYPRQKDTISCGDYDPRYRPWYAEAASSRPKDIVLVFDRSGSIQNKGLLPLIKNSTLAIIQSLNADDRVALVAFNNKAHTPPGVRGKTCFYENMAIATPDNKKYLSSWVKTIDGRGLSQFTPALEQAFKFLKTSGDVTGDPRPRRKVIVMLSDGEQAWSAGSDDTVLTLLRDRNAEQDNSVLITAYGIGDAMSSRSKDLFRNMSMQTLADTSKGPITPGQFIQITSSKNLRSHIGSYYNTLSDFTNGKPIMSTPYVDFSGLGLVVSVCLPVYPNNSLKGVTCIDISLTEIAADAISLHNGINAYAFICDYKSRTIIHPLMPDALNYGKVVYLDINDLERNNDVKEILRSMKRGESRDMRATTDFIKARGNTTTDGVEIISLKAHYYWKQIGTANFSLAVVTTDSDTNITVDTTSLFSDNFIYHRVDLVDRLEKCISHGRLSTIAHSVVKLTEEAFVNPTLYTNNPDTKEAVNSYTVYMEARKQQFHRDLKLRTKQMIAISEKLETIWKDLNDMDDITVWRYYGDYYGHVRIFPGLSLPQKYDPTQRGFFWKAVSNEDVTTMTPPYLDAFGAGIVATISVPIFLPRVVERSRDGSEVILGVLNMDIKMRYLKYIIEEKFPACLDNDKACFIMDTSGYLVYHSGIAYNDDDKEKAYDGYHITEVEPDVSKYLINQGYLVQSDCVDFGYKQNLLTWRVSLPTPIYSYDKTPYFDMVRIFGTNVYLGIKKKGLSTPCDCPDRNNPDYGKSMYHCMKRSNAECSCPCVKNADYDHCKNQFVLGADGPATCYPQPRSIGFRSPIASEEEQAKHLHNCYMHNCSVKTTKSSCWALADCSWCNYTDTCMASECQAPVIGSVSGSQQNLIIGVAVGVSVVILLAILLLLFCLWRKGKLGCCGGPTQPRPGVYLPEQSEYSNPPNTHIPTQSPSGNDNVVWNAKPDVVGQRAVHMKTIGEDIRVFGQDQDEVFDPPRQQTRGQHTNRGLSAGDIRYQ